MSNANATPNIVRHIDAGEVCCDPQWEDAYRRFETAEEEIAKFVSRLKRFGFERLPKEAPTVELFCGRGGGLVALERLGFQNIAGVDLSDTLLAQYRGPAQLHLADCRELPFEDDAWEIAIVQGGLHHLPTLPDDLDKVLSEVRRVLKPTGTFYVVEPWLTPFLRFVHAVVSQPMVRKVYAKGDALAAMIDHERETYEQWLAQPDVLLKVFHQHFEPSVQQTSWGKLVFAGVPRGG